MSVAAKKRATAKKTETVKPVQKEIDPEFVTPAEFAKMFKIGRSTVQSMMDAKVIRTIPIPTADPNAKKQIRRIPFSEVTRIKSLN